VRGAPGPTDRAGERAARRGRGGMCGGDGPPDVTTRTRAGGRVVHVRGSGGRLACRRRPREAGAPQPRDRGRAAGRPAPMAGGGGQLARENRRRGAVEAAVEAAGEAAHAQSEGTGARCPRQRGAQPQHRGESGRVTLTLRRVGAWPGLKP
jgi:hypothetical protein